jgi:hypothetical protein
MTNVHASSPEEAAGVLRQVESLQRQTRVLLRAFWFPLVVFGAITLASTPVQWLWAGGAVGIYWALAGPLGGVGVGWYYRSRALRLGLSQPVLPYVVTAIGILLGAFILPAFAAGDLQQVISLFAVAAGYLAFAWLDRSPTLAGLAVVMAAVPALVLMSGVDHPGAIAAGLTGLALLVTGLVSRPAA